MRYLIFLFLPLLASCASVQDVVKTVDENASCDTICLALDVAGAGSEDCASWCSAVRDHLDVQCLSEKVQAKDKNVQECVR